jgi:arylsulfatase A-like enzyme
MKRTAIFIALSFLSFFAMAQRNVILIIADDLGTDYCGFYEDHADTAALPNIRRLVNRGVRFTNPMSNPVCSPTRAGILTGRYSFRTGVGEAVGGTGSPVIDTSEVTIPRVLKLFNTSIGTANIGKWHLSLQTPASNLLTPNWMGYDHYAGNFLGALTSYTSWTKVTDGITSTSTNYATTETASDAINWVKLQASNPFFLWLARNIDKYNSSKCCWCKNLF